jgi:hypothetical protein
VGGDLAPSRWRTLASSVAGTSHVGSGRPCADASVVRDLARARGGSLLVAAVADGAGDSPFAPAGSRIACDVVLELAREWAGESHGPAPVAGRDLTTFDRDEVRRWLDSVRVRIAAEAARQERPPSDFSCTLIVALVDAAWAVFFQIGDGAAVYRRGDAGYALAFWPQNGEYANSTWFVTDEDAPMRAQSALAEDVHEIALFTDGLQALALRYATRDVHSPFFTPMFERLRAEPEEGLDGLAGELDHFLDSAAVNQRTDDDKTLVLATRLPPPMPDTRETTAPDEHP